jgi:hypothetical protein
MPRYLRTLHAGHVTPRRHILQGVVCPHGGSEQDRVGRHGACALSIGLHAQDPVVWWSEHLVRCLSR